MPQSTRWLSNFKVIKDQPDKPPSQAQLEIRNINNDIVKSRQLRKKQDDDPSDLALFKSSLVNLFKNWSYVVILISYGINTGAYYSISTLLNQVMSQYYEVSSARTLPVSMATEACLQTFLLDLKERK